MKIFIFQIILVAITLSSLNCYHAKQAMTTEVELNDSNEIIFKVKMTNLTDTTHILNHLELLECWDDWYCGNKFWFIEEHSRDTFGQNLADCCLFIDTDSPFTLDQYSLKPQGSYTYTTNISKLLYDDQHGYNISSGDYLFVAQLHCWDYRDTTIYEKLSIKKELNFYKSKREKSSAYWILDNLKKLSSLQQEDNDVSLSNNYHKISPIRDALQKNGFFLTIKKNGFSLSKKDLKRIALFAEKLQNMEEKQFNPANLASLKADAKYFYKHLRKQYIKEIPNFKNLLKNPETPENGSIW